MFVCPLTTIEVVSQAAQTLCSMYVRYNVIRASSHTPFTPCFAFCFFRLLLAIRYTTLFLCLGFRFCIAAEWQTNAFLWLFLQLLRFFENRFEIFSKLVFYLCIKFLDFFKIIFIVYFGKCCCVTSYDFGCCLLA